MYNHWTGRKTSFILVDVDCWLIAFTLVSYHSKNLLSWYDCSLRKCLEADSLWIGDKQCDVSAVSDKKISINCCEKKYKRQNKRWKRVFREIRKIRSGWEFCFFRKRKKKDFLINFFFRDRLDKFVALAQLSRAYCIIICTQTHNMWPKIASIIM